MSKLSKAFELFDDYNKQDPHTLVSEGKEFPTEYYYALQLYNWVIKLDHNASEALLLASRSQHIGQMENTTRLSIPRVKQAISGGEAISRSFTLGGGTIDDRGRI